MEENRHAVLPLPHDYSGQRRSAIEKRIQQTVELLADKRNLLVLMHNDPDPDAIASARALKELVVTLDPNVHVDLAHGGLIGRAENRTMASLFAPDRIYIQSADGLEAIQNYDGIMLVDTQPGAGNHLLWGTDYPLENVLLAIDHHPPKRSQTRAQVHDVRPEVGASSTILCEYLAVAEVPIDAHLATALFYGIKSDTLGLSRHTSDLDIWAYSTLRNLIETELLNRIEHVQLPRSYYRSISEALANTTMYPCVVRLTDSAEEDVAATEAEPNGNQERDSVPAGTVVETVVNSDNGKSNSSKSNNGKSNNGKSNNGKSNNGKSNGGKSNEQSNSLDVSPNSSTGTATKESGQDVGSLPLQDVAHQENNHTGEKLSGADQNEPENRGQGAPKGTCIGDVAISLLFDMKRPDMAAEVADLLMRMEDVVWAICLGIYEDRLVISVRTDEPEARAGRLVRSIVGKQGTAGGHDTMAGGRVHLPNKTPAERVAELHALVPRFLNELGAGDAVGVPLLDSK